MGKDLGCLFTPVTKRLCDLALWRTCADMVCFLSDALSFRLVTDVRLVGSSLS